MKEVHLFYAPDIAATRELPPEEAAHAVRVLRMREGDTLLATDGKGAFYDCTILAASAKRCALNIDRRREAAPCRNGRVMLAVAPTKSMDRMEWMAEKATEIGLDKLSFLNCRNSERRGVKTERIEKIIVAATKQSQKAWKPEVEEMAAFKAFVAQAREGQKFIAHCQEGEKPFLGDVVEATGDALVLIGPEGDFSPEEVAQAEAAGFQSVSLGNSRLRTETAALVAAHIANLAKRR